MNQSNLVQEILSIRNLLQNNTIGIILGDRMNLDTAAAALGFYLSLVEAGKNPQIISKKDPIVEIANLVGIDKVKKSFSGDSNKVVVSLPYNRGEIGKVSYKEENDRINFYLTAAEGKSITNYDTSDINLIWDGAMPSVIAVFGMSNASQLAEFISGSNAKVINVDNSGEPFGDISIVSNEYSSVSEITAKILRELRLPLNIDIAQNLLDGIMFATNNFTKPNTSGFAFELAGVLIQAGAERMDNRNTGRGMFENQNRNQQNNQNQNRNQRQHRPNNQQFQNNRNQQTFQNREKKIEVQRVAPPVQNEQLMNSVEPEAPQIQNSNNQDVPDDWLMPKVFKGSQNVDDLK